MNEQIATRCIKNLESFWEDVAKVSQGTIIHTPHTLALITNINIGICNPILRFDLSKLDYTTLKQGLLQNNNYQETPFSWWASKNNHANVEILNTKELDYFGEVPVMYLKLTDKEFQVELPKGIIIKKLDVNNLDEWTTVIGKEFKFSDQVIHQYQTALKNLPEKLQHFCALDNEKIIATGSLYFGSDFVGLYNLATLAEYQKQGIATAMKHYRLNVAKQQGYSYATLQATPDAVKLNSKIGFSTATSYEIFIDHL